MVFADFCREGAALWICNFQLQMAGASLLEGDPETALSCASKGLEQARRMGHAPLQVCHMSMFSRLLSDVIDTVI